MPNPPPAPRPTAFVPGRAPWIDRFDIGPLLGRGAGSVVHLARDLAEGGRVVALKRLPWPGDAQARAQLRERLEREADLLRRLGPATPGAPAPSSAAADPSRPAFDAAALGLFGQGHVEGVSWQALEWMPDGDLQAMAQAAGGRLPGRLALAVLRGVAEVLDRAHRIGVVHRDLKPSNILMDRARHLLRLSDFGVAHLAANDLTVTGTFLGTPAYMAPEQLAGATPDGAADAYALGVIGYELLAGRRPHEADSLGALLRAVGREPIRPLQQAASDVDAPTASLVMALLARTPAQRPKLAPWAAAVGAVLAGHTQHAGGSG